MKSSSGSWRRPERFIFLEYFIIKPGVMWDGVLDILKRKVQQGVEVRVMYDGTNAMGNLPWHYPELLRSMGIQCQVFSPMRPALSTVQNNRDHRKIVVIDGRVAFTAASTWPMNTSMSSPVSAGGRIRPS